MDRQGITSRYYSLRFSESEKVFDKVTHQILVDDAKVFRKVNNDDDKQHLQNDLDKLVK